MLGSAILAESVRGIDGRAPDPIAQAFDARHNGRVPRRHRSERAPVAQDLAVVAPSASQLASRVLALGEPPVEHRALPSVKLAEIARPRRRGWILIEQLLAPRDLFARQLAKALVLWIPLLERAEGIGHPNQAFPVRTL